MINFKFGKSNKKQLIIIGIILSTLIAALSQCSKISENTLWDLFDEIQREFFPQTIINEVILKDPDKINRRVERDVTRAIEKVTPEYDRIIQEADKKYQTKYIEEKNDESLCYTDECKALAPPMRICAPWLDDCPKD
jgi:Holliday junction resolvasome RuvABC ATP-dependent DNA helicase subunit